MKLEVTGKRAVAFILGLCNFLYISSFAQVIIVEILFALAFLIRLLGFKKEQKKNIREFRAIIFFGILWFISQSASDFANRTNPTDSIKSVAQIFVLLSLIYWGHYWSKRDIAVLKTYLAGYAISSIPQYFFLPGIFGLSDPWKFIFGPSITLICLLFIQRLGLSKLIINGLLFTLVCFDFIMGSRSLGLITLVTLVMLLKKPLKQSGLIPTVSFLILFTIGLSSAYSVYENLTLKGIFGFDQQQKFENQSHAGPILLVARSELLYELEAIKKTRILGLGSNPYVDQNYLERVALAELNNGVHHSSTAAFIQYSRDGRIPAHSMILSAWMESGIFGLIFWLYLTWLVVLTILNSTGREPTFGLLLRYLTINYLWAAIFSPLGAGSRMVIAITITLVLQEKIGKI
jgi:hypothetical protein